MVALAVQEAHLDVALAQEQVVEAGVGRALGGVRAVVQHGAVEVLVDDQHLEDVEHAPFAQSALDVTAPAPAAEEDGDARTADQLGLHVDRQHGHQPAALGVVADAAEDVHVGDVGIGVARLGGLTRRPGGPGDPSGGRWAVEVRWRSKGRTIQGS